METLRCQLFNFVSCPTVPRVNGSQREKSQSDQNISTLEANRIKFLTIYTAIKWFTHENQTDQSKASLDVSSL